MTAAITADQVKAALSPVKDPVTGRGIVGSGQVQAVDVSDDGQVHIQLGLISPGYPLRDALDGAVREALSPLVGDRLELTYGLAIPHRPARQDLNRLPTVKNIIAVAAGKGGVGKSTTSVNLAMTLQQLGAKVGILDADIYGPSIPKMMGEPQRETSTAEDGNGIIPSLYRGIPVMSVEFFVEPGNAIIWRGPMIHKLLTQFLETVDWGDLDYLVVDMPPGTGDAQLSLGQLIPITGAIIVTTPQEVALIDVRKAINMFEKLDVPVLGIAENMSFYSCPACGHHAEIFGVGGGERLAKEFSVEVLARIPIDPKVALGGESGRPIVDSEPSGEHAKSFKQLAASATLECAKRVSSGPRRSSLLRTVD